MVRVKFGVPIADKNTKSQLRLGGQIPDFQQSCGLGLCALSQQSPSAFACEVVVGEGLVRDCVIVDCFLSLGSGSNLNAKGTLSCALAPKPACLRPMSKSRAEASVSMWTAARAAQCAAPAPYMLELRMPHVGSRESGRRECVLEGRAEGADAGLSWFPHSCSVFAICLEFGNLHFSDCELVIHLKLVMSVFVCCWCLRVFDMFGHVGVRVSSVRVCVSVCLCWMRWGGPALGGMGSCERVPPTSSV